MSVNLDNESWLSKLKYPTGYLKTQVSKHKSMYDSPTRKMYDASYVYDMIKYIVTPFTEWDAYKEGIINDKGKKLRSPNQDEYDIWNYYIAQLAYLKTKLEQTLSDDKIERIFGRMSMVREQKENTFETMVSILEETQDNDIFEYLKEATTTANLSYTPSVEKPTFRQFLNQKLYGCCKNCKYCIKNDCELKPQIVEQYGDDKYNKWITEPESKNDCMMFDRR